MTVSVHLTPSESETVHDWGIIGHQWAVERLQRALAHQRVRHAYLFLGAEALGKETLARAFAMTLNCLQADAALRPCGTCSACQRILSGNHPDVIDARHDEASGVLKIEEIRRVMSALALKPFEGRYRIALLRDFHLARPQAQDALLKTLEEPPPGALLLLLATSTENILPTILSRSQIIQLRPVLADELAAGLVRRFGADPERALLLARLSGGRVGWAVQALHDPSALQARDEALDHLEALIGMNRAGRFAAAEGLAKDRQALARLLELWLTYWRDVLLLAEQADLPLANLDREEQLRALARRMSAQEALDALRATRALQTTLQTNANLRLALEVMLLDYPGLT
jgi:DNA polymerase-3 subunit delta'